MADDVLKALLENELLTDDVKNVVAEAFNTIVEQAKQDAEEKAVAESAEALKTALAEAREEMEAEVRTELAAKFLSEREELVKSLDEKVTEMLSSEIKELSEDIEAFRDLEVEFAAKLEDEKQALAEQFSEEKKVFITKIDEFVESRLKDEMQELHEDINVIKQNTFAREVFETFRGVYEDSFADPEGHMASVKSKLEESENEKAAAEKRVQELEESLSEMKRSSILESTLAPLSGKRRAVMESILSGFETDKIGAVYEKMLPRVMDTVKADEEASEEVAESVEEVATEEVVAEAVTEDDLPEDIAVEDGNSRLEESETEEAEVIDESKVEYDNAIRKLAGIN